MFYCFSTTVKHRYSNHINIVCINIVLINMVDINIAFILFYNYKALWSSWLGNYNVYKRFAVALPLEFVIYINL